MLLAGPVSHISIKCMNFVEILNVSLDLSTSYFAHLSRCRASFVYSCCPCRRLQGASEEESSQSRKWVNGSLPG